MSTETINETIFVTEIVREPGEIETVIEQAIQLETVVENIGPPGVSGPPGERGLPGPDGNRGPPGPPGGSFDHIQVARNTMWTIAHNLGYRPSVTVLSAGNRQLGPCEVQHISADVLTLEFLLPVAGSAHLV